MKKIPQYSIGDMVSYKLSNRRATLYAGVVISHWHNVHGSVIYEIASLSDNMCSYSIGEPNIDKKVC
jgi:hypothetical protein